MKIAKLFLALLFAVSWSMGAQQQLGPKDGSDMPPTDLERVRVGSPAPDFTLISKDRNPVTLSSFAGKKNVLLVFYRGYWWPYCIRQLGELKKIVQAPAMSDTQVIAVSSELPPDLYKAYNKITENGADPVNILFLSDVGHKVIDRYGILNPDSKGLPHPATYLIDKKGIVRWKSINVDFRVRPTNEQILGALKLIP